MIYINDLPSTGSETLFIVFSAVVLLQTVLILLIEIWLDN